MARKLKPVHLFVPISRVDEAERLIEGHAFVNEVVPGEGGVRLKRTAMESATADYMRWGALREMHQPSAAGTALGVEWDETGAFFRAKVVDDAAWKKVQEGVYKGLSVGVIPQVMRGNDVEKCCWAETSLVDRPKDPDAAITVFRVETLETEAEVEVEEADAETPPADPPAEDPPATDPPADPPADPTERAYTVTPDRFSDLIAARETAERQQAAWSTLHGVLSSIARSKAKNRAELAKTAIGEFADYYVPLLVKAGDDEDDIYWMQTADLTRLETLQTDNAALVTRAETAEASLATAQEQIQRLEQTPRGNQPVRFPEALERTFSANAGTDTEAVKTLRDELQRLEETLPKESDEQKRRAGIQRMQVIEFQLRGQT